MRTVNDVTEGNSHAFLGTIVINGGGTVLPNGVKVAVRDKSQKCQKLTKVGLLVVYSSIKCISSKNHQFVIKKFANSDQIKVYFFDFCYLCLFY